MSDIKTKVYICDTHTLNDHQLYNQMYDSVPDYRKKKVNFYRFFTDKRLSLAAGVLLSLAIKDLGLDESQLEVVYNENNQPSFKNHPEIHYSISHSGHRAMLAISSEPIGCDLERDNDDNEEIDLDDWTRLESYAKATQSSLDDLMASGESAYGKGFFFKKLTHEPNYHITICSKLEVPDDAVNIVDLLTLKK